MHKIVYFVSQEEKDSEIEWLREQMIFPAVENHYDFKEGTVKVKIGMIVGSEAALTVKLRRKLNLQTDYRQRQ